MYGVLEEAVLLSPVCKKKRERPEKQSYLPKNLNHPNAVRLLWAWPSGLEAH